MEDNGSKGETKKSINIRSKVEITTVGIKRLSQNAFHKWFCFARAFPVVWFRNVLFYFI